MGQGPDVLPQDSVEIPLKIRFGIEVTGPVIYFTNKDILNTEGFFSYDLNEKMAVYAGGGYSDYKYSQYNYDFRNKGTYFKAGVDFNILKPEISNGRYWAGVGLRYGISRFKYEIPSFTVKNYWGDVTSSILPGTEWGHYLELSPGFRAEIMKNISIGWSVSIRKLLFTSTGKDLKPLYFPGYGLAGESFSTGITYFITWNFSYRKIKVPVKQEAPEVPEEDQETESPAGIIRTFR